MELVNGDGTQCRELPCMKREEKKGLEGRDGVQDGEFCEYGGVRECVTE